MNAAVPPSEQDELIAYLRTHDAACPGCGYNLRHLRQPRCPECGSGLALTVGVVRPFLAAWVTMVGCLFTAAGVGLLMLLIIVAFSFPPVPPGLLGRAYQGAIFYSIASIPVAVVTAARYRPFLRLNHRRQTLVACTVALLTLGMLGALTFGLTHT